MKNPYFRKRDVLSGLMLGAALYSAAPASAAVSVNVTPHCVPLAANASQQFQAAVSGSTQQDVVWMVDGVKGGAPAIGTISATGLYKAPADPAASHEVLVTAVAAADQTVLNSVPVCVSQYAVSGRSLYVATTGSDTTGTGTQQKPWKTIQHGVDQAQAGDTVVVRGGVYNETVTISHSGSASAGYITLTSASGEQAIIDGTGLVQQPYGTRGLVNITDQSYVRVRNMELRNYESDSEFIVVGILVQGVGDRIELKYNSIHDIKAKNLPANGSANGLGIAVYGFSSGSLTNVVVDTNYLFDLETGKGESLTVGGNVDGWQVTNNQVHDNNFIGIDAIGYYNPNASDPEADRPRNGWIAGNSVYNLSSADNQALTVDAAAIGIYVDGGKDITIERNNVDSAEGGVWLLSEKPGKFTSNVVVRNNLIRFNAGAGVLMGGYSDTESGGAENCVVTNNTPFMNNNNDDPGVGSGEFQISHNVDNSVFRNNILVAGDKSYTVTKFSPAASTSIDIGNNIYNTTSGPSYVRWYWISGSYFNDNSSSNDFAAYKLASGDVNSLTADPLFAGPSDLRLQATSPGVNSGAFGASFGFPAVGLWDYAKAPRVGAGAIDRGAYQHAQ